MGGKFLMQRKEYLLNCEKGQSTAELMNQFDFNSMLYSIAFSILSSHTVMPVRHYFRMNFWALRSYLIADSCSSLWKTRKL